MLPPVAEQSMQRAAVHRPEKHAGPAVDTSSLGPSCSAVFMVGRRKKKKIFGIPAGMGLWWRREGVCVKRPRGHVDGEQQ
jgi:hypothetical protein